MIVRMAESQIKTQYGEYDEILYYDGQKEIIVFIHGQVKNTEEVLCRVHSSCIYGHYINSIECDCRQQLAISQQLIQEAGKGIIIILEQEGKGNGHFALMQSKIYKKQGFSQAEAYKTVGFKSDARDFSRVADILKDISVKSICMLTDNANKVETLTQFGISVIGTRTIDILK